MKIASNSLANGLMCAHRAGGYFRQVSDFMDFYVPGADLVLKRTEQTTLYRGHGIYIGYLRVSTDRQAASGLGLEAQRTTIEQYAARQDREIAEIYVETESGKLSNRPQLNAALAHCRRVKATLLIAKLDRLARNVAFVSTMMESGAEFVAVDAPYANKLMLHILAAFAEHEREQISERTKAALAAAKARGVVLGKHGAVLGAQRQAEANRFAATVRPAFIRARNAGCVSLREYAAHLTISGVPTPSGGKWHASNVSLLLRRLGYRYRANGAPDSRLTMLQDDGEDIIEPVEIAVREPRQS